MKVSTVNATASTKSSQSARLAAATSGPSAGITMIKWYGGVGLRASNQSRCTKVVFRRRIPTIDQCGPPGPEAMLAHMTYTSDRNILRWGGLASLVGALLFVFVFAWVIALAGPDPAGVAGPIS